MIDDFCPDDAICLEEPTCMMCGRECKTTEYVWTGDENSYKGWELWCYCEHCKIDTFHKLVKYEKEINRQRRFSSGDKKRDKRHLRR